MLCSSLFAQAKKAAGSPFDKPELIYASAGLAATLLVGAVIVYFVDRWRKKAVLEERGSTGAELTSFRAMYENGEITEEEYAKLRLKVADRVKVPAAAPESPAVPPAGIDAAPTPPPSASPTGPVLPGPLPPGYFDDPDLSPPPAGTSPPPS